MMALAPISAAITVCETGEWKISNLALQKLLYLAQMTFLGRKKGKPLLKENFEAWDYGPVVPSLYQQARIFGSSNITSLPKFKRNLSLDEHIVIREVVKFFGHKSPGELVDLTHRSGGAWANYYRPGIKHIQIPNDAILAEYKSKVHV